MILLAYVISTELPKSEKVIILLIGALLGGFGGISFFHFLHAHYDQSDALIQVAKFQERSLTRRNDALSLVEKIRQEVEEEKLDKIVDSDVNPIETSSSETSDEERKEQEKSSEVEKDKTADWIDRKCYRFTSRKHQIGYYFFANSKKYARDWYTPALSDVRGIMGNAFFVDSSFSS